MLRGPLRSVIIGRLCRLACLYQNLIWQRTKRFVRCQLDYMRWGFQELLNLCRQLDMPWQIEQAIHLLNVQIAFSFLFSPILAISFENVPA